MLKHSLQHYYKILKKCCFDTDSREVDHDLMIAWNLSSTSSNSKDLIANGLSWVKTVMTFVLFKYYSLVDLSIFIFWCSFYFHLCAQIHHIFMFIFLLTTPESKVLQQIWFDFDMLYLLQNDCNITFLYICFSLVWILVVSLCVGVFLYYMVDRIAEFLKFRTTMAVQEYYVDSMSFPSVTICNQNKIR